METGLYISPIYVAAPAADKFSGAKNTPASSLDNPPNNTIADKVDISEFSVTSPVEDFLPQSRPKVDTKKHFKNMKEYIAYLLMLYEKIDKIKPMEGRQYIKLEDRLQLNKLEKEFNDLSSSWKV